MQIVDFFYMIAQQNLRIRGFRYGRNAAKGAGSDMYPLIWLDDPIYGQTASPDRYNALTWSANVDILDIPKDDAQVIAVQAAAFHEGIGIAEHARKVLNTTGVNITGYNFTSLRDYYDDRAAGFRFTYNISQANPVDRCLDSYDPNKVLLTPSPLSVFATENPDGCAVFADRSGLVNFKV